MDNIISISAVFTLDIDNLEIKKDNTIKAISITPDIKLTKIHTDTQIAPIDIDSEELGAYLEIECCNGVVSKFYVSIEQFVDVATLLHDNVVPYFDSDI